MGRRPQYQTYSTHCRSRRANDPPCAATSRKEGNGCAAVISEAPGFFSSSSSRSGAISGLSATGLMLVQTEASRSDVRLAISPMTSEDMNCPRSCHCLAAVRHTARNQILFARFDRDAFSINQQRVAALHH